MALLAHQGGWDELLLPLLIVALVLVVPAMRRRRRAGDDGSAEETPGAAPEPGTCPYCGASVPRADERCPACGFRVRR
jgi:hypothetical protein